MAVLATDLQGWIAASAGPAWLQASRAAAVRAEAQFPLPRWDRTDISGLDLDAFAPPAGGEVVLGGPGRSEGQGVIFGELAAVAAAEPDLVQRFLGRGVGLEAGRFEARNAAAHQGAFLHVPEGVALAEPLEITYRAGTGGQFHPRTVIALGRGAEATVLCRSEGGPAAGAGSALITAVVEADLADGAHLNFVELQNWGQGCHNFAFRQAELGRDAGVRWLLGELGGGLSRSGTTTVLRGAGSEALATAVFFASDQQHMDLLATLIHHGARTDGLMLARGVLTGLARTIYRGTSDIRRGAKGCNSQQKERTLHLNAGVRSDAIPALFIDENELQAGHAATTGRVDAEQMFYMAARGLPPREATRLIVHGFFAPLVERIPGDAAKAALEALIDQKIDGMSGV